MKTAARAHTRAGARRIRWSVLGAGLWCAWAPVRPCLAQDNPALRTAVQLAAEGRGDSARHLVAAELAKASPGDPAYVEALYWRGRLAASGDSAERDLRRVAIEYSTSPYADEALLQLAQLAMAAGNSAGALQLAQRLRNDYPTSPLRGRAALWAGRAAFEAGDPATACALLDSARTESSGDVEFLNQVAFYRSRCANLPRADSASPGDTGRAPARSAPGAARAAKDTAAGAPATQYEVQVTATRSSRTAQALLARLKRAGEHGHIVKGADGLLRLRVGPFPTDAQADTAATRLKRLAGGHPFVVPIP